MWAATNIIQSKTNEQRCMNRFGRSAAPWIANIYTVADSKRAHCIYKPVIAFRLEIWDWKLFRSVEQLTTILRTSRVTIGCPRSSPVWTTRAKSKGIPLNVTLAHYDWFQHQATYFRQGVCNNSSKQRGGGIRAALLTTWPFQLASLFLFYKGRV